MYATGEDPVDEGAWLSAKLLSAYCQRGLKEDTSLRLARSCFGTLASRGGGLVTGGRRARKSGLVN